MIDELAARERLLKLDKLRHSYPHCWRHKSPIIFRATTQWFVGMDQRAHASAEGEAPTLRHIAGRAVDETQFFPAWGRARLEAMMKTRPTGASRASATGACRSPSSCTARQRSRTRARPS